LKAGQTIHFPWTARLASVAGVVVLLFLLWLNFTSPEFRQWVHAIDSDWRPILRRSIGSIIIVLAGFACLAGALIGLLIDIVILNLRG
jgi:hypothetical protein